MIKKIKNKRGMTLVEVIIVVVVMALLMASVERLVRTTWLSWITADRRVELLGTGRPAMSKLADEIRLSYDLYSITDTRYIDYYPQWATSTVYRFYYDSAGQTRDLLYGTGTPTFASTTLAAPLDSFTYTTYTRRMDTGVNTRARRVNSFKFLFTISDERNLLPVPPNIAQGLNPMYFQTKSHMRMSREGYSFAKSSAFASESTKFSFAADTLCIKAFNDRVEPAATAQVTADVYRTGGGAWGAQLDLIYNISGDYWATCCKISTCQDKFGQTLGQGNSTNINIYLEDFAQGEWEDVRDQIWIAP